MLWPRRRGGQLGRFAVCGAWFGHRGKRVDPPCTDVGPLTLAIRERKGPPLSLADPASVPRHAGEPGRAPPRTARKATAPLAHDPERPAHERVHPAEVRVRAGPEALRRLPGDPAAHR